MARLHPVKDHATLLQAVQFVLTKRPDFRLDVVGDGPERQSLEALRRELRLEGAVTLHGHHDDVRPFLLEASLFVLASLSEGISLTVLEAMAASLPVVATDVGETARSWSRTRRGSWFPRGRRDRSRRPCSG